MTTSALLDQLTEQAAVRPLPPRPGTTRAIAIGEVEIAESQRSSDTFMRARWKERVRGSATPYLVIADDPAHPGRVRVLGPSHGNRPIQSVSAELLSDALQEVAKLPAFDAVRRIADDLSRIGGDGLTVNGLLTRHTLEYRFKGDPARWASAAEEVGTVKPNDSWQHVICKLGYQLQQLPQRGYLARFDGKPVGLIHPKRRARDLARVDSQAARRKVCCSRTAKLMGPNLGFWLKEAGSDCSMRGPPLPPANGSNSTSAPAGGTAPLPGPLGALVPGQRGVRGPSQRGSELRRRTP